MQTKSEFRQGWYFMAEAMGADLGSSRAFADIAGNIEQNKSIQERGRHTLRYIRHPRRKPLRTSGDPI